MDDALMILPFWPRDLNLLRQLEFPQHTVDVDGPDLRDVLGSNIVERGYLRNSRIVDDDVQAAERTVRVVDGREHLVAITDVGHECRCLRASSTHLVGDPGNLVLGQIHQGDVVTVGCQPQCDGPADALPRSRHQHRAHADAPVDGSTKTFIFVPACSARTRRR